MYSCYLKVPGSVTFSGNNLLTLLQSPEPTCKPLADWAILNPFDLILKITLRIPSYPFVFPDNHVRAASVCMMSCLQSLAVCICLNANLLKTSDRSISQSSRSSRSSSPSSSFLYCKRYKQTSFLPKTSRGFQLVAIHSMRFSSLLNNLNTSTYATMHGVNKVEKPY